MDKNELISLTAHIVGAYVENNSLAAADLPGLIANVHSALTSAGSPESEPVAEVRKLTAAQIKKSIQPDGLVSFEDGKIYKSLKRNLTTKGLTPDQYRAKWGLPKDYPMVSPNYSAARSALAKESGLGQKGRKPATPAPAPRTRKPKAVGSKRAAPAH